MTSPISVRSRLAAVYGLLPGVLLSAGLALTALALRQIDFLQRLSPLILALGLGMALRNTLGLPAVCRTGVTFSLRRLLRLAVMLIGFRLSLHQLMDIGGLGVLIVLVTVGGSYVFVIGIGSWLGIDRKLCALIAAGTSICGASAVLAANTVAEGSDEDATYAVAVVTVFGTLAVLAYPLLLAGLRLSEQAYGLWAGSSIHEIAQVMAAVSQQGEVGVEFATISKLARVLLLAPLVALLAILAHRKGYKAGGSRSLPVPAFVLGFVGLCLLSTVVRPPKDVKDLVGTVTTFLLAMSLAAMGLEIDVKKLTNKGLRPLLLGAAGWLFIAGLSYALIRAVSYGI